MAGRLKQELRLKRPFRNAQQEAFLNIMRTADALEHEVEMLLKLFGVTSVQYNVLRILHSVGEAGRTCSDIGRRMVERHPDITRLLDRMEHAGLIRRRRDGRDRRTVTAQITLAGSVIVQQLEQPLSTLHQKQFAALSDAQVYEMIEGMEKIRFRNGLEKRAGNAGAPGF